MNKDLEQVKKNSYNIGLEVEYANSLTFAIKEHLFHFSQLIKRIENDPNMTPLMVSYEFSRIYNNIEDLFNLHEDKMELINRYNEEIEQLMNKTNKKSL